MGASGERKGCRELQLGACAAKHVNSMREQGCRDRVAVLVPLGRCGAGGPWRVLARLGEL